MCFLNVEGVSDQDVHVKEMSVVVESVLKSSSVSVISAGSVCIIITMKNSSALELIPTGYVHTVRGLVTALVVYVKISCFSYGISS